MVFAVQFFVPLKNYLEINLMEDLIVAEVRDIRKKIESENGNDWDKLEKYLLKNQKRHKDKLYSGFPKSLPKQVVV